MLHMDLVTEQKILQNSNIDTPRHGIIARMIFTNTRRNIYFFTPLKIHIAGAMSPKKYIMGLLRGQYRFTMAQTMPRKWYLQILQFSLQISLHKVWQIA